MEYAKLNHVNIIERFTVVTVLLITVTTQINKTYTPPLAVMFIIGMKNLLFITKVIPRAALTWILPDLSPSALGSCVHEVGV